MGVDEAIKVLHWYQKYRRGGIRFEELPYSVKEFGIAIDVAIRNMRKISKDERSKVATEVCDMV
jgi:hypothetical protein